MARFALSTKVGDDIPNIIETANVREEAGRQNLSRLAAIGTKEGFIDAICKKVGSSITNSVLQTSDGTEAKSVDKILLSKLLKTVLKAAEP